MEVMALIIIFTSCITTILGLGFRIKNGMLYNDLIESLYTNNKYNKNIAINIKKKKELHETIFNIEMSLNVLSILLLILSFKIDSGITSVIIMTASVAAMFMASIILVILSIIFNAIKEKINHC